MNTVSLFGNKSTILDLNNNPLNNINYSNLNNYSNNNNVNN